MISAPKNHSETRSNRARLPASIVPPVHVWPKYTAHTVGYGVGSANSYQLLALGQGEITHLTREITDHLADVKPREIEYTGFKI